jgi:titin
LLVSVVAAAGKLSVGYLPPASNGGSPITAYKATCTSTDGGVMKASAMTLADPIILAGLSPGHNYSCTMTAKNAIGTSGPSAPSNTVQLPTAPGSPTVTEVSVPAAAGKLSVSYTAPGSDGGLSITGYKATCASSDGGVTKSSPFTLADPITVAGLSHGDHYTCTMIAKNAVGISSPSAPSGSVRVPSAPDPPTITLASPGSGKVTITYTPGSNGGLPVTGYHATCTSGNGGVTKSSAVTTNNPILVSGLSHGHTYTCTITAKNIVGTSSPSTPTGPVVVS